LLYKKNKEGGGVGGGGGGAEEREEPETAFTRVRGKQKFYGFETFRADATSPDYKGRLEVR
jgi:hypothetical protein